MTLGKRRAEWVLRLLAADVVVLLAAFLVAYRPPRGPRRVRSAASPRPLGYYLWLLGLIVPLWLGLLAAFGAYGMHWTTRSRLLARPPRQRRRADRAHRRRSSW